MLEKVGALPVCCYQMAPSWDDPELSDRGGHLTTLHRGRNCSNHHENIYVFFPSASAGVAFSDSPLME